MHPVTSENIKDHSIFSYTVDRNLMVILPSDNDCKQTSTCLKHSDHNLHYKHFTYYSVLKVKQNAHGINVCITIVLTDDSNIEERKAGKHAT